MTDKFTLVKEANVKVTKVYQAKGKHVAEIVVNDKYTHRFEPSSRVSKHLDMMTADELSARLTGGTFFFIEDQMIDMRDGMYNGFVHSPEAIQSFMDTLGYQERSNMPLHRRNRSGASNEDQNSKIVLRKVWSDTEIVVPGYQEGGDFTSQLSFIWNPFVKTINSSFDLVRQICTNGMVGIAPFLNTKIPMFNRWEEHLDISSRQIQNKVNSIVIARVGNMSNERATVADCALLGSHAFDRLNANGAKMEGERDRLMQIMNAVNPESHLSHVYRSNVFADKNLGSQLPSHLTAFDVYNIATEMRSHTMENGKSSNGALDKFSNRMLFDNDSQTSIGSQFNKPALASFSDADRAFFGDM